MYERSIGGRILTIVHVGYCSIAGRCRRSTLPLILMKPVVVRSALRCMLTWFWKPVSAERTPLKTQVRVEIVWKKTGIVNLTDVAKNSLSSVGHFTKLMWTRFRTRHQARSAKKAKR